MSGTKIKICGLSREQDAAYVNETKPDYVGFIFWTGSHRCISHDRAVHLRHCICKDIQTVGVFVNEKKDVIADIAKSGGINLIQLHGDESEQDICYLKEKTGLPVIKAVKIKTGDELLQWNSSQADFLLLDSGYGTGKPFDWSRLTNNGLSAEEQIKKPFFLAGGLGTGNLKEAINLFHPYAVDLSSSVETDRVKDLQKIREVVALVRGET